MRVDFLCSLVESATAQSPTESFGKILTRLVITAVLATRSKRQQKISPLVVQVWRTTWLSVHCSVLTKSEISVGDLTLTWICFFHSLLTFFWESFKGHLVHAPKKKKRLQTPRESSCLSFSESFSLKTRCRLFRCSYEEKAFDLVYPVFLSCVLRSPTIPGAAQGTL